MSLALRRAMPDDARMNDAMLDRAQRARKAALARWGQTPRTPVVVKSLRIDPDLWIKVIERAAVRKITPNEWLVRCVKDGLRKAEEAK